MRAVVVMGCNRGGEHSYRGASSWERRGRGGAEGSVRQRVYVFVCALVHACGLTGSHSALGRSFPQPLRTPVCVAPVPVSTLHISNIPEDPPPHAAGSSARTHSAQHSGWQQRGMHMHTRASACACTTNNIPVDTPLGKFVPPFLVVFEKRIHWLSTTDARF